MNNDKLTYISITLAILLFPLSYVSTKLCELAIKTWNPMAYNAQQLQSDLAYLAIIIYFGLAVFAITAGITIFTGIKAWRKSHKNLAVLSLVITAVEVTMVLIALLLRINK